MSPEASAQALEQSCIDTVRFLAVDAVQKANSGHPGMPMGAAPMAHTLFTRHLRFDPADPAWPDRDRFVLSAGHGSMLLYSLLHLTGYDLSLDDLRAFRQWGSRTPGHPEYGHTAGVETTTGPLGQGFANAVGMAVAERFLGATFNGDGPSVMDHFTYVIAGDGDMMEGISGEAASFAGHQQLGKLIVLYDDNHITIDGSTDLAFTEDVCARFAAYEWHVQRVADGNDLDAVDAAIAAAKAETGRPSLIAVRTHIGFGSPNKQDTAEAHGAPLGADEVTLTKENLGWPLEPTFLVPPEVKAFYEAAGARGAAAHAAWRERHAAWSAADPSRAAAWDAAWSRTLPAGWDADLPVFKPEDGGVATRAASGKVINALAPHLPTLIGGSADLAPSNNTWIKDVPDQQAATPAGRNFHFGVREHAMAAIGNGLAVHGGVRPYVATFFVFTDYMRPALRLAAIMGQPVIHVLTHDSIGVGEDGPTHQPVEHLAILRATPELHRAATGRRQRDGRGLEGRPAARRRPGGADADAPEPAHHRPRHLRAGERRGARRLRARRRGRRGRARDHPHRQRQRGAARRWRRTSAWSPRACARGWSTWRRSGSSSVRTPPIARASCRPPAAAGWPSRRPSASAGSAGSATRARSSASTTSAPRPRPGPSSSSSASRPRTCTSVPRP